MEEILHLDNAESLLKGRASRKINRSQFKKEYNNIADDVEIMLQNSMFTSSQNRMVEILSLLGEISNLKDKKQMNYQTQICLN